MATTTANSATALGQYLTFVIGEERYGIAVLKVREIMEYTPITPVPGTPQWIRGVANVRGNVVPIIDLARKFNLQMNPVTMRTCIIIVEIEVDGVKTGIGLVADAVSQVVDLREEDIEPSPEFGTPVHVDFLVGMGKAKEGFILLLDIDYVITTDEFVVVDQVAADAESAAEDAEDTEDGGKGVGAEDAGAEADAEA